MTIADIYAFVVSNWANMILPEKLENFPNISRFAENMMQNKDIQFILEKHKSVEK